MAGDDPLATYNAKRDFTKTAEPAGTLAPGHGNSFMVQKHDATRLHWDLRLEIDGVLKSWAVTRGPSLDPGEKRLAVRTEDHPLSYATFEGTIPAKEYGGGTVMLWDRGTWSPIAGKSAKDLDHGHLHFVLDGERMKGEWLLIRLRPRAREKRENWLLRKIDDAEAGGTDTLVDEALTSVATGRTMIEIADGKKSKSPPSRGGGPRPKRVVEGARRARSAKGTPPPFTDPQLATLVDAVPTGTGWMHEIKYDGYRALIAVGGGTAKVFTRSGLDWTDKFQAIAGAAAALPVDTALIDGEIVALKDGKPDFSTLKDAISSGGDMTLFAFDLLDLDGEDLTGLGNADRKDRLRAILPPGDRIQFAEHILGSGEELFDTMCSEGLEGIVSKRADAPYRGKRTKAWLKVKCTHRQEFVIIGWLSSDKRRGFKSLLLGVHEGDALRYAGKVGTGFDTDTMDAIATQLARSRTQDRSGRRAQGRGARRALGDPQTRRRNRLCGGDARRRAAPFELHRPAWRQGRRRRRRRTPRTRAGRPRIDGHRQQPRPRRLSRFEPDEGRPRRLLSGDRTRDAAMDRPPPRQPRPLPARARAAVLLPETRCGQLRRIRPPCRRHRKGRQRRTSISTSTTPTA